MGTTALVNDAERITSRAFETGRHVGLENRFLISVLAGFYLGKDSYGGIASLTIVLSSPNQRLITSGLSKRQLHGY